MPAALRAYPFRLVEHQDGDGGTILCIDEASGAIVDAGAEDGHQEVFFDAADEPSPALKTVVDFLKQIERDRRATQRSVDLLQDAGLIEPWPLQRASGGQKTEVRGVFRVNEAALATISDDTWKTLRAANCLPLVYAQLFSMERITLLEKLASVRDRERNQWAKPELQLTEDEPLDFNW